MELRKQLFRNGHVIATPFVFNGLVPWLQNNIHRTEMKLHRVRKSYWRIEGKTDRGVIDNLIDVSNTHNYEEDNKV